MLHHARAAFKRSKDLIDNSAAAVLDVGCNRGVFLAVCKANGWSAHGCEVSEKFATEARQRFGLTVENTAFEEFATGATFDLVTFWDVFEHFSAPKEVLAKARDLLCPGGLVAFEVPNVKSIFARLLRSKWWFGFEHIFYYSPAGLCTLLQRGGFEPILVETTNVNLLSREGLVRLGFFGSDAVWGRTPWRAGQEPSASDLKSEYVTQPRPCLRDSINRRLDKLFNARLLGDQLVIFGRKV
jgi:SAM-dependent methyltransferase